MQQMTLFVPMFEDFDDEGRDAENHWYDTDHVPQRLSIPGFLAAARYERVDVRPRGAEPAPLRYLNAYLVESPEVLASPAYAASFRHRTPRSEREDFTPAVPVYRDVWVEATDVRSSSLDGARAPEVALVVAFEPHDAGHARTFLGGTAIPLLLSLPGFLGARLFDRVELEVADATAAHAPRIVVVFSILSPEAVTRPGYAAAVRHLRATGGLPRPEWLGVYRKRTSPWELGARLARDRR